MMQKLKNETEYLKDIITNVTVSFPIFFSHAQQSFIYRALKQAGLQDPGCHPNGHSGITASTGYYVSKCTSPGPDIECAEAPMDFGLLLGIEYDKVALTINFCRAVDQSLLLHTGLRQPPKDYLIAVKPASHPSISYDEDPFWETVTSGLREIVIGILFPTSMSHHFRYSRSTILLYDSISQII